MSLFEFDHNEQRVRDSLLPALQLAVPMWIGRLRGTDAWQRVALAKEDADVLALHGDALMFGARKGQPAQVFNALARGIAVAAYQLGGVTAFGHHWCADPGQACVAWPPELCGTHRRLPQWLGSQGDPVGHIMVRNGVTWTALCGASIGDPVPEWDVHCERCVALNPQLPFPDDSAADGASPRNPQVVDVHLPNFPGEVA